jgi:4-cresol dehydrogenase (hydroxylating) flavoprotein subunit
MLVNTKSSVDIDATQTSLSQAISAWRLVLGDGQVLTESAQYNTDTSSFTGRIPVALRPTCTEQVQHAVRIAQRFSIQIYPISTGHNWGYGTSVPVRSPSAVIDLSSMNKIIDFDRDFGIVTLEPGVTQGELSEYLSSRDFPFMVPVTGAGPSCSVVANALERGFGVTPITDHFAAILSMKVVLPGGEIYESYTRKFNAAGVARAFKWSTGPYFDGLFSQSNLGIVVDASIALQARTERCGALFFVLDTNQDVQQATGQIRQLLTAAGSNIGAINLMSRSRVECMLSGSQKMLRDGGTASLRCESMPAGAWFGFGSVYGSKAYYRATIQQVKRCLRGYARQIRVYTSDDLKHLRWLSALAVAVGWPQSTALLDRLQAAIDVVRGVPSTVALPLAYAKSGRANKTVLNPAHDGCGLFWYSPVVPLRLGVVEQFIEFVERTCGKHGLLAPITLTTLSQRCYAATIPLLFDRASPDAERRAMMCFEELYEKGLVLGFVPYRIGSQFMPALARSGAGISPLANAIKSALDPNHVLAPGRYSFG